MASAGCGLDPRGPSKLALRTDNRTSGPRGGWHVKIRPTTAAAQDNLGGTTLGKALFQSSTTAAAQNLLEASTVGLGIWKASTTAAQQNLLEAGTVGLAVWKAATTAAAT